MPVLRLLYLQLALLMLGICDAAANSADQKSVLADGAGEAGAGLDVGNAVVETAKGIPEPSVAHILLVAVLIALFRKPRRRH